MPKDQTIRKVLVIGSGPIVIGQAAEFDYAGAQACRVLKQEGINVVLVNSNPATIMTDQHLADEIYLEPLNAATIRRVIEKERPDGLIAGLGGQTGLTLAMQLSRNGTLDEFGVRLLGSPIEAIEKAEDREKFRETMLNIGQPCVPSGIAETLEEALAAARASSSVSAMPEGTHGWPIFSMVSRNFSRSSALSMASMGDPSSRTPNSSSVPLRLSCIARVRPVWPPRPAIRPSGRSFSMTRRMVAAFSGSR